MDEMLSNAILKVRKEYLPQSMPTPHIPEPHVGLYEALQIFDIPDGETVDKVKYIHEYLSEGGKDALDGIIDIHSKIGAISSERLTDRVYKYCKLKETANKALARYKNLKGELRAIRDSGRQG